MSVLKCKICGGQLQVETGKSTAQCKYCDSVQTIPKLDSEEKIKLFEKATELRLRCEFDQAAGVFQNIVTQFPDEAEAYWGLCLCKYGIEYVDDPMTLKKIITCHRTERQSIFADKNYLMACQYSAAASWKYQEEALKIDELQKKILDISLSEKPYDIFICYKEVDDATGIRTDDSVSAQDIYTELVKNGYRVFYARVSLRGKAGTEYEPYIYSALTSAKIMLVLGSKKEYFNAVWLKNEWSRYLDMMKNDRKVIIPCYENIIPEDLPVQLKLFQALDMGSKIFFRDLLNSIERIVPKKRIDLENPDSSENISTSPKRKELNFNNGVYIGEALGNKPHGYGTYFFVSGAKYEGNWRMGTIHGEGVFTYQNGDSWSGEWKDGVAWNGEGKFYYKKNKKSYCLEGRLEKGSLNGYGTVYLPDNQTCTGEFKGGVPYDAEGTYFMRKMRGMYTGKWKDGEPTGCGKAVIYYTNGNRYEGGLVNGIIEGQGTFFYPAGSWTGEWKEGKPWKGNGLLVYYGEDGKPTGKTYTGYLVNGKADGEGTLRFGDGSCFEGEFFEDNYYNGKVYNAAHQVIQTYVNGKKQEVTGTSTLAKTLGLLKGNIWP